MPFKSFSADRERRVVQIIQYRVSADEERRAVQVIQYRLGTKCRSSHSVSVDEERRVVQVIQYQQTRNDVSFKSSSISISVSINRSECVRKSCLFSNQSACFEIHSVTQQCYECLQRYLSVDTSSALTEVSISRAVRAVKRIRTGG